MLRTLATCTGIRSLASIAMARGAATQPGAAVFVLGPRAYNDQLFPMTPGMQVRTKVFDSTMERLGTHLKHAPSVNPYLTPDYTNVDLTLHHDPSRFSDKAALNTVKFLRFFADTFFQKKYGHRAVVLETVAAIPGMVGGMMLHLRSLRRLEPDHGLIKTLLEEAENERMHLMTYMEIAKPTWFERMVVLGCQGLVFNAYFIAYFLFPKTCHRFVGYLEEEAVKSYTQYLEQIDEGKITNIPAPAIAIDYWQLDKDARLREVVAATRADEAHHRDMNHYIADEGAVAVSVRAATL